MDLETKEDEAGPANPHHSHDHSQSLPFVHHIMTNSRFRTSWGKKQLLLAIFLITLTAERVICLNIALSKKRLLLSAPACPPNYDHNPISDFAQLRNTGHDLSLIEFKLRFFCWQIDGTNVSNVPLRFALDRIRAADRRVRLHIKKADHTEVCSSKYTSWHFTSVKDKNFKTRNIWAVSVQDCPQSRETGDPEMFVFLLRDVNCRCYWSLLGF